MPMVTHSGPHLAVPERADCGQLEECAGPSSFPALPLAWPFPEGFAQEGSMRQPQGQHSRDYSLSPLRNLLVRNAPDVPRKALPPQFYEEGVQSQTLSPLMGLPELPWSLCGHHPVCLVILHQGTEQCNAFPKPMVLLGSHLPTYHR